MTDEARADDMGDEDRLPWLEAVEEDEERGGPSIVKLAVGAVIGLVAIAVMGGGLFWLADRNREGGNGQIIAAPRGRLQGEARPAGWDECRRRGRHRLCRERGGRAQGPDQHQRPFPKRP
jgi:hypothetical protein